jgi:hypothetical protein
MTQLAGSHVTFAKTHAFKVGSKAYLTLTSSGKIASMSMTRPVIPPVTPTTVKTTTVTGTVASAMNSKGYYKVNYTFAKKPMATYTQNDTPLKIGSHVTLNVDSHGKVVPVTTVPPAVVKKPVYKAPIAMTAATKKIKAGTGLVTGVYPVATDGIMEYDNEFPHGNMIHTLEFKTITQTLKKNQTVKLTMDSHGNVLTVNGETVVA